MHTFTSRDLKAGAFPQVGVDPLDVQRVDREPALVPPVACKCGVTRPAAISAAVRAGLPPRRR